MYTAKFKTKSGKVYFLASYKGRSTCITTNKDCRRLYKSIPGAKRSLRALLRGRSDIIAYSVTHIDQFSADKLYL